MSARHVARPLARGLIRLIGRTTTSRRFNGTRISVPVQAAKHIAPFRDHAYDPLEWDAIDRSVRPGDVCLDIGANIGVMSVLLSRRSAPRGEVFAFEPQPTVYAMLVELLERNHCANVTPLQAVLLDRHGTADLHLSDVTPLGVGSSALAVGGRASRMIRVPALTIDLVCHDLARLDYIKIDAEGAEALILSGAQVTLERCRPVVQVEVHGQYLEDRVAAVTSMFDAMAAYSYICVNLATGLETDARAFLQNTHHHVTDPHSGVDLATRGYGQVLFVPPARIELVNVLRRRPHAPAPNSLLTTPEEL